MDQLFATYNYADVVTMAGELSANEILVSPVLTLLAFGWVGFMITFLKVHARPRSR